MLGHGAYAGALALLPELCRILHPGSLTILSMPLCIICMIGRIILPLQTTWVCAALSKAELQVVLQAMVVISFE